MKSQTEEEKVNGSHADGMKHVVICGGGPGGVMAALCLLQRNEENKQKGLPPRYRVTLVDNRKDFSNVKRSEIVADRSWMIGLSLHGITSIESIPGIWEKVKDLGVEAQQFVLHVGDRHIKFKASDVSDQPTYIVDRNHIVWSLTHSLFDRFGGDDHFTALYNTKCLFVDGTNKRILLRSSSPADKDKSPKEYYLDYDILIGADGIRSVVRAAFQQYERHFECTHTDIFLRFNAFHIDTPTNFEPDSFHIFPDAMPNMQATGLPELGNKMNFSFSHYRHKPCPQELHSKDPNVILTYLRKHLSRKSCTFADEQDVANQWVQQEEFDSTGQVTCNMYHSQTLSALLLGDAAHATSPVLGMGMNTALADAVELGKLLDKHNDDWNKVLPAYSKERVKEGRSLTALSYYLRSMKPGQAIYFSLRACLAYVVHKVLPFSFVKELFPLDPQTMITKGVILSKVYDAATKMGMLRAIRHTNDTIRREWEEKEFGMVNSSATTTWLSWFIDVMLSLLSCGVLVGVFAVVILWVWPSLLPSS